jgi:hypothetical protein
MMIVTTRAAHAALQVAVDAAQVGAENLLAEVAMAADDRQAGADL